MAGYLGPLRSSPTPQQRVASRFILLLTLLPLALAAFAFLLQWRGGVSDPSDRWSLDASSSGFPGTGDNPLGGASSSLSTSSSSGNDCFDHSGRSLSSGFPYFKGWSFKFPAEQHPKAFIIASTSTQEEMLQWYHELVVWSDNAMKIKLLRKGILTRIYALTVMIQVLQESGIFSSLLESTKKSISKQKFLSSIDHSSSSNISEVPTSRSRLRRLPLKPMDSINHQAASQRTLAAVDSYPEAVPPLSPTAVDDDLLKRT